MIIKGPTKWNREVVQMDEQEALVLIEHLSAAVRLSRRSPAQGWYFSNCVVREDPKHGDKYSPSEIVFHVKELDYSMPGIGSGRLSKRQLPGKVRRKRRKS